MTTEQPFTLSEISRKLFLSAPTVANWRSRYAEFPKPILTDGKRELWTIEQIETFMASSGLDGRGRKSRKHRLIQTDYTKAANLVEILRPIFRPEEAIVFILIKAWDTASNTPCKSLQQLEKKVSGQVEIESLTETVRKATSSEQSETLRLVEKSLGKIVENKKLILQFTADIRTLWSESGRERASSTSPLMLGEIIGHLVKGKQILDLCAGLGSTLTPLKNSTTKIAQEIDPMIAGVLFMLLQLEQISVEIRIEDSLQILNRDWLGKFDTVIAVPPSRTQEIDISMTSNDPRWMKFGSTRLRGEEAWILNALAYLDSDGVGLVCLPTKWMTSAASKKFREKLVGLGYLQGTISLGHDFYSDNRIEMTLLVLSASGKPNRQIRIADARNIGVQETGVRDIDAEEAKEIALLISTDHSDRAVDVVAEQLVKFGSPIEFNAYMAYQESKSISNPKEIQGKLNRSLYKIADQYEMLAKKIRELTVLDDEINFGSQNDIHRLQDLATIEFFTRNKDEDWPSFEILPDDIILPLIHDGEKPVSPICSLSDFNGKFDNNLFYGEGEVHMKDFKIITRVCRIRLKPAVKLAEVDSDQIYPATLYILLNSPDVQNRLQKVASTSNKKAVPAEVIRNLLVPCPPKHVQEKAIDLYYSAIDIDLEEFLKQQLDDWDALLRDFITAIINKGK